MDIHSQGFLTNLLIYLSAAVIAVPIFTRLRLGSVLGYLFAGACIGPWGFSLIQNVQDILNFSEIGVVLLLFLIGLELQPRKLWEMRRRMLGLGGAQVLVTALLITLIALPFTHWQSAIILGFGLALSSTAIVLQTLREKNLLSTPAGNSGFSVLLLQDIAVIPIIALVPLLAFNFTPVAPPTHDHHPATPFILLAALLAILLLGKNFMNRLFAAIAATNQREIFTALSLLLVASSAALMNEFGISMELGAFLAGVLLANSEYRHALESDIEPFKGLLLGLFFISVGMSVDFGLLLSEPLIILALTLGLLTLKSLILYAIAHVPPAGIPRRQRWLFAFILGQGSEFGFVIFAFAVTSGALDPHLKDLFILVIALSMAATPLCLLAYEKWLAPRHAAAPPEPTETIPTQQNPVIIIGFGRFGQVVGRLLMANKITPTLIDNNPAQLERVRRFGYKSYYGDALRLDVLRSAGASQAKLIVLAMANTATINHAIDLIRREFPHLKIYVRAYDRGHAMHLIDNNIDGFARETFLSALELATDALQRLGFTETQARARAEKFKTLDLDTLHQQVAVRHDEQQLISIARTARQNIEDTFTADQDQDQHQQPKT